MKRRLKPEDFLRIVRVVAIGKGGIGFMCLHASDGDWRCGRCGCRITAESGTRCGRCKRTIHVEKDVDCKAYRDAENITAKREWMRTYGAY